MTTKPTYDYGQRLKMKNGRTYQITGINENEREDGTLICYHGRVVTNDGHLGEEVALWWLDEVIA